MIPLKWDVCGDAPLLNSNQKMQFLTVITQSCAFLYQNYCHFKASVNVVSNVIRGNMFFIDFSL